MLLTDPRAMEQVLEYVVAGDTAQLGDPAFVAELKTWICFSADEAVRTGDGLYTGATGNPSLPRWLGSRLIIWAMTPKSENDRYARQVRNSVGIAVFFSAANDKAHWVQAGRCYQRFALQATALGVRNAFLNQAVEVAPVRSQFASMLGLGSQRPDLVVRFRRGPALPLSMRRPVLACTGMTHSRRNNLTWIEASALAVAALAAAAVGLAAHGAARWARRTRAALGRLDAARTPPNRSRYDMRELDRLPAPVQRFFRSVLREGQPIVASVTLEHPCAFNMILAGDRWKPFTSLQRVVTNRPGFVWNARIALLPCLPVYVHDGYITGTGILHAAALGLFTVAELRGRGAIAKGELMRYLAEAAWYPTALLPSQSVHREAVDVSAAKATLTDSEITATLTFRFDTAGLIESVRSEARGRAVGDAIVMSPWKGRWSNYQERSAMRVPLSGEVAWLLPEGPMPYWRGTVSSLACDFSTETMGASICAPRQ